MTTLQISTTPPLAGLTLVNDINAALAALAGLNQGASAPTTGSTGLASMAGVVWHDTSTNELKVRDQADSAWIILGYFDETNKNWTPNINAAQFYAADSGSVNAMVLAPTPAWTAYFTGAFLIIVPNHTNTSTTVTANVSALGAKAVVQQDGTLPPVGSIVAGLPYFAEYDGTSIRLLNPPAPPPAYVKGAFSNLKSTSPGGVSTETVTADSALLLTTAGVAYLATGVNVTGDISTSGVGGLDTGSVATSTWYSRWLIWNGTTLKRLYSLSATAPTMPGGYTFKLRDGWVRTDGSANIMAFIQTADRFQYINGGAGLQRMAVGPAGSISTPVYVAVAWASFAPPTTKTLLIGINSNTQTVCVAPSNNYGAYNSQTNPPPFQLGASGVAQMLVAEMVPESSNVYWFSNGPTAQTCLFAVGFTDNL